MIEKVELFKKYRKVYYDDGTTRDFQIFDFVAETDEDMEAFKEQRAFVRTNTGTDLVYRNIDYAIEKDRAKFNSAIQGMLDKTAQVYGWDNMLSARGAASEILEDDSDRVKSMKENANELKSYYYLIWDAAAQIELDVANGDREMPTVKEVLEELPAFENDDEDE